MKTKLYSPDIECDSCIKVLTRAFNNLQGIENFHFNKNEIEVEFDESLITKDNIVSAIQNKGYRVFDDVFNKKSIKQRTKDFIINKSK